MDVVHTGCRPQAPSCRPGFRYLGNWNSHPDCPEPSSRVRVGLCGPIWLCSYVYLQVHTKGKLLARRVGWSVATGSRVSPWLCRLRDRVKYGKRRRVGCELYIGVEIQGVQEFSIQNWHCALAGVTQLVGGSSHKPNGGGFKSLSGHIPRLQFQSPVRAHMRRQPINVFPLTSMSLYLSLSFSPFISLSKGNKKMSSDEDKKNCKQTN